MKKNGFTLMELLAVIVIIGLVIVVAIPASNKLIKNNKEEKYKLYVETVEKAVLTYADMECSAATEYQTVSISDLVNKKYLARNDDVEDQEIKFIKDENGQVTFESTIKLTFDDGKTTCSKTECKSNP